MDNFNQQPYPPAPQTPTSIIPPPEQPPPSNRSWLKWVLVIIFVALLSSGGTYFILNQKSTEQLTTTPTVVQTPSPTPNPDLNREPNGSAATANWKTYTNSELGFSFKYLPILSEFKDEVVERIGHSSKSLALPKIAGRQLYFSEPSKEQGIYSYVHAWMRINVYDIPRDLSDKEFVTKYLVYENDGQCAATGSTDDACDSDGCYSGPDGCWYPTLKPFKIGGIEGHSFGFIFQGGLTKEAVVKNGSKLYYFELMPWDPAVSEADLLKSLASFNFL